MRYVTALFDAPVPTESAVRALHECGFSSADLLLVPSVPGIEWSPGPSFAQPWFERELSLQEVLGEMGVSDTDADLYAEGVIRGAILLAVRSPTLSAPYAEAAIESAAPASLSEHRARWLSDPVWRYGWSVVPPPSA
jgi:hypothetical protein